MAFTALATKVYRGPIDVVWANSIQGNDDFLFTGCIKAWINFDGSAGTLSARASNNVASITDSGVGLYTITYTTGFTTSGYVTIISCVTTAVSPGTDNALLCAPTEQLTGSTRIKVTNASAILTDPYAACIISLGIKS